MDGANALPLDSLVTGFGGVFCLIWATGRLLARTQEGRYVGAAFIGISGLRLTWEAFFFSGQAADLPTLFAMPIPFTYLIGPVIFLYFGHLLGERNVRLRFLHLIPAVIAVMIVAYWATLTDSLRSKLLARLLLGSPFPRSETDWALLIWIVGPKVSIFAYSIAIPLVNKRTGYQTLEHLSPPLRRFARVLLWYVWAMILCDIVGYLLGSAWLFRASAWSHSLAAIIVYLFSARYPGALLELNHAFQTVRYARSKLEHVDVDRVMGRLDYLMKEERYYADEDLRLSGLAAACDVSPHQLSEILNERLGVNFSGFVNQHRVEAARKIMDEEPERSVLSIAMAVGFNSKSSFNRAFRKHFDQTPMQIRSERSRKL